MFAFFEKGAFIHGRREEEERKIYEFVNEYAEQNKVYPSYREIAKGIGFSCASSVYLYIKRMAENGKLEINANAVYPRKNRELWQYLQKKMAPYAERIAFARARGNVR